MRVTVPCWPLLTQAPSGPTATSTVSAPIEICLAGFPVWPGYSRVTVPLPAFALHTDPAPTATRIGAGPAR
jgi:hypothetical protein